MLPRKYAQQKSLLNKYKPRAYYRNFYGIAAANWCVKKMVIMSHGITFNATFLC